MFVLGDSASMNLHTQTPPPPSFGLSVTGSTQLGCDLLGGSLIVNDVPQRVLPVCARWPATWRAQLAGARPGVALLMTGNGFLFDRDLDGRRITFGSAEYRDLLRTFLDRTLKELAAVAPVVAVTDLGCFGKQDTGLDDTATVMDDVGRQRAFNAMLREVLSRHPAVRTLALRAFTCPQGRYEPALDGVRLHVDGVHWTPGGARLVWSWLAPRLHALTPG